MSTATKSVLTELEKLERDRDQKHECVQELTRKRNEWDQELQAKRAQLSTFHRPNPVTGRYTETKESAEERELSQEVKGLMAAGNPIEDERQEAIAVFHEAEVRYLRFKVGNALEVVEAIAPDGEKLATELSAAAEQFKLAIGNYRMGSAAYAQALQIVGIPRRDLVEDSRIASLATMLDSFDLSDIMPPHSRSLHSDTPLYRPSEDSAGWVS